MLLSNTKDKEELFTESLAFVQDKVPPECWAKSKEEFQSRESHMYHYLDEMFLNIESADEMISYIHYRAAARAYEACLVTNQPYNIIAMRKEFESNLDSIKRSLQNKKTS